MAKGHVPWPKAMSQFSHGRTPCLIAEMSPLLIEKLISYTIYEFIRVCLKLPRYISTRLLHEAAGLEMVNERLKFLAEKHFEKLKNDDNIRTLIERRHSFATLYDCNSPLDVLT